MNTINESLVEDLQNVSHPGAEYEIKVMGATIQGQIIIRNGRIKYARCGKLKARAAVENLIQSATTRHKMIKLSESCCNYLDEMDDAPAEIIIPLLITSSADRNSDITNAPTEKLTIAGNRAHCSADLHMYDIRLEYLNESRDGEICVLQQGRNLVGRSDQCHLALQSDSVSRVHAIISVTSHAVSLQDLQTTNGTRVNGKAVMTEELNDGDILQFGSVKFKVSFQLKIRSHAARPAHSAAGVASVVNRGKESQAIHFDTYESIPKRTIGLSNILHEIFSDDYKRVCKARVVAKPVK